MGMLAVLVLCLLAFVLLFDNSPDPPMDYDPDKDTEDVDSSPPHKK